MKKTLKLIGVILTVIGVLCLLLSALFFFIAMNTHDAPASLSHDQYMFALAFLAAGVLILILGIFCLVLRKKRCA